MSYLTIISFTRPNMWIYIYTLDVQARCSIQGISRICHVMRQIVIAANDHHWSSPLPNHCWPLLTTTDYYRLLLPLLTIADQRWLSPLIKITPTDHNWVLCDIYIHYVLYTTSPLYGVQCTLDSDMRCTLYSDNIQIYRVIIPLLLYKHMLYQIYSKDTVKCGFANYPSDV